MTKLLLTCLACFPLYMNLFAQNKIEGHIKDHSGSPIPFATVSVLKPESGTILFFSSSDEVGDYSVEVPDSTFKIDNLILQVTCLGYEKETRTLHNDNSTYHFILEEQNEDLEPVIIKGKRVKLRLSGDTLSYDVSSFAQPSDRVIEDVIKKLPGVDVDEEGRIKYNGKYITNFYIEGDDLLKDKYAVGTKNIPNGIVDKIEVFENHQPIKVLSEITVTDQVDMNITLKDDAKIKPINQLKLGGGLPGNFDGALTSILFMKKFKAINYFKTNNIGVDLEDEITSFNLEDFLNRADIGRPQNLLSLGTGSRPQLPQYRYLFNNTGMINTNNLATFGNDVQIRTNLYYLYDRQRKDYQIETAVILSDDTVHYIEQQQNKINPNLFHAEVNLNINKTGYYLNNTFQAAYKPQSLSSSLNTNGSQVEQTLSQNMHDFSNELNYMFSHNRKAFEFYSYINSVNEPEEMMITPGLNADYFNNGLPFQGFNQTASIPSFLTNNYFKFHSGSSKFTQSYKIGFNTQRKHLHSSLLMVETNGDLLKLDSGVNDLKWKRNKIYLENDYQWKTEDFILDFSLPVNYLKLGYADYQYQLDNLRDYFIFDPEVRLKYKSGLENNFIVDYRHRTSFGGIDDIYRGYILKNYRTIRSNHGSVYESNTHTARLAFLYKKTLKVFFANLNVAYSHKTIDNISRRTITDNLEQQYSVPLKNSVNSLNLYGGISKYLFRLKTTVSANVNWSRNKTNLIQNNQLQSFNNYNTLVTGDVNSKVSSWLYLLYSIQYGHFQSKPLDDYIKGLTLPTTTQIRQNISLDFQLPSNFSFEIKGEQLYSRQSFFNTSNILFVDALLKYKWDKYKMDLEAGVQNITDVDRFYMSMVNESTTVINRYVIRGRMALLKVFFKF